MIAEEDEDPAAAEAPSPGFPMPWLRSVVSWSPADVGWNPGWITYLLCPMAKLLHLPEPLCPHLWNGANDRTCSQGTEG